MEIQDVRQIVEACTAFKDLMKVEEPNDRFDCIRIIIFTELNAVRCVINCTDFSCIFYASPRFTCEELEALSNFVRALYYYSEH